MLLKNISLRYSFNFCFSNIALTFSHFFCKTPYCQTKLFVSLCTLQNIKNIQFNMFRFYILYMTMLSSNYLETDRPQCLSDF